MINLLWQGSFVSKKKLQLFSITISRSCTKCSHVYLKLITLISSEQIENYHEMMKENASAAKNNQGGGGTNTSTLAGLLQEDFTSSGDSYFIDNAWRGAEAFHFYLLAQRQLYEGRSDAALRTVSFLLTPIYWLHRTGYLLWSLILTFHLQTHFILIHTTDRLTLKERISSLLIDTESALWTVSPLLTPKHFKLQRNLPILELNFIRI